LGSENKPGQEENLAKNSFLEAVRPDWCVTLKSGNTWLYSKRRKLQIEIKSVAETKEESKV
jgi:hypothetical protein